MKLLLDTQIFLWDLLLDPRLPANIDSALDDPQYEIYFSVVSLWEAIIKYNLGKLALPRRPEVMIPDARAKQSINSLDLDEVSVSAIAHLPSVHADPFDRALIGQALAHGLILVTVDEKIKQYPVPILS